MDSSTPDAAVTPEPTRPEETAPEPTLAEDVTSGSTPAADALADEPSWEQTTGPAAPEPVAGPAAPRPVPSLSLDEAEVVAPSVPDLDAIGPAVPRPELSAQTDPEPVGFDLGGDGYAENLAQQTYGQPAAPQSPGSPYAQAGYPPASPYADSGYPQPGPFAPLPNAGAPYPPQQTPYAPQPAAYAQQPPYVQPSAYPEQNPYAPVPYAPAPTGTLSPDEERTWAGAAHWSAIAASVVGLGFLGPLLVYLIQGPKSAWVKAQAAESLNFEITFIISMLASLVAMLVVVGFVTVFVFPVVWLVFRIIATVATTQGRDYRYPVNIRLVK